jgi:hypothetical protein
MDTLHFKRVHKYVLLDLIGDNSVLVINILRLVLSLIFQLHLIAVSSTAMEIAQYEIIAL